MSLKTKKYLITTESHEVFIIREGQNKMIHGFCPECQKEAELMTLDLVTSQIRIRTREIFEVVENNLD